MALNGKHPFGTSYVMHLLKKNKLTWDNYKKLKKEERKVYDDTAHKMLLACLFVLGCKTGEPQEMYNKLSETYAHSEKNAFPQTLHTAVSLYRYMYMPMPKSNHKRKNNNNESTK